MSEYIDKEKLLNKIKNRINNPAIIGWLFSIIDTIPSADVRPVVRGEWIECFEDWRKQIVGDKCSICGFEHYGSRYNFCPNCGRDMRGE